MSFSLNILTFHRIMMPGESYFIPPMAIAGKTFSDLVANLKRQDRLVRLDEAVKKIKNGCLRGNKVAITFDDGYIDNYTVAKNVLRKQDVPATFFVPTRQIDESNPFWWDFLHNIVINHRRNLVLWFQESSFAELFGDNHFKNNLSDSNCDILSRSMVRALNGVEESIRNSCIEAIRTEFGPYQGKRLIMNWSEIKDLHNTGFEIGSHTVSHIPLTDLPLQKAAAEIENSKVFLSRKLGVGIRGLCYPRGKHNDEIVAVTSTAGYEYAVTTGFGGNNNYSDPHRLKRRNMCDYQGVRGAFPVAMHLIELTGILDKFLAKRRAG